MLRIVEMAKLCGVSIETLRYYDKENILTPDRVDEKSGCRQYSNESVEKYRLIEQLKELEFTLDEIWLFLCSDNGKCLLKYSRKKAELLKKQSDITKRILCIDSSCSEMNNGYPALNSPHKNDNFIDDPDVIGRWDYCGDLTDGTEFKGEDKLTKSDIKHKKYLLGDLSTYNKSQNFSG